MTAEMRRGSIILDRLPVKMIRAIPLGDFTRARLQVRKLDSFEERLMHDLYEFSTQLLAGKILSETQEFTFEFPATWWQHWKQAHAASWYGRRIVHRWPVKTTVHRNSVRFDQYAAYPLAAIDVPPEFGYPVVWETMFLTRPLEAGMKQVYETNPRIVFAKRGDAERAVAAILTQQALDKMFDPGAPSFNRLDIQQVFDVLAQLGVNPDQLISRTAIASRHLPLAEE